jgi:hypothetical protein
MAQSIGVQRNAISIVANALQRTGIIRYSRGRIEITDLEGLQETSCECYRAVRTQHDRLLKTGPNDSVMAASRQKPPLLSAR